METLTPNDRADENANSSPPPMQPANPPVTDDEVEELKDKLVTVSSNCGEVIMQAKCDPCEDCYPCVDDDEIESLKRAAHIVRSPVLSNLLLLAVEEQHENPVAASLKFQSVADDLYTCLSHGWQAQGQIGVFKQLQQVIAECDALKAAAAQ